MSIREKTGPQALEQWARNAVDGKYPGVSIKNMTTSWRNGLAFCALIHRFHPELIDFETLEPNDIRGNCTLAFEIAESKLGIPSLLDPEDFVNTEVPDRLSVLTYVAQIYNFLKNSHKTEHQKFLTTPEKVGIKRPGSQLDSDAILESTRDTSPKRPVLLSSPAVCSVCQNPVYITERVLFAKKLFHRSCFRCTNCDCVLNPQTADYSPEGLFCLDKDCQKQFRKLNNSPSSRIMNNNHNNNYYTPSPIKLLEKQNGDVIKMKQDNDTTPTPKSAMNTTIPESISVTPSPILSLPKKEISSPIKSNEIEEDSKDIPNNSDKQEEESQVILQDKNHIPQEINDEISSNQILSDTPDNSEENLVEDKEEEEESRETISQENSTVNELSEDRLNVEEIVEPEPQQHEKEKVRSVSFSAIVSVAKIEPIPESDSTSNTELVDNDNLNNIENNKDESNSSNQEEEINETAVVEKDTHKKEEIKVEEVKKITPPSPKPKPKNAIDFLKENLETMSAQKNPFDEDEDDDENNDAHKENNIIEANNYGDGAAGLDKSRNGELELEEKTSRNESGVGDSFESEMVKNDEIESGDEDRKSQVSSISTHDIQHSKDSKKEHTPNHTTKPLLNESSDSLSGLEGQGEAKAEEIIPPVRRPRVPRSSSPANTTATTTNTPVRPSPSPRKRISTSELWKTKDYYPAELNPFESEDTFTLQPSDILIVKKASSHERIPPSSPFNPFEDDEDEPEPEKQSIELLVAPKSPVNSIKSGDSISNSGSVRSMKKRRAPLPPSMIQNRQERIASRIEDLRNRAEDVRMKGPAPSPPNPNQISSPYSNNNSPRVSQETSPKKIIPASPDLLKGLKTPNSVGSSGRKKRRAPPPKRHVAALPEAAIKQELSDLAIKEKEFERQGINLEAHIRRLMEEENENDTERIDEMVIQLWSIVNEKNDILRRQTELDYLRRGHRLEEQQAEVEFQLRVLMETPTEQRKEDQEETEEQLLQELLKLVDERAEVIEWLDRVTSEILVEPHMNGEEDLHSGQSFSSLSRSSPTSQNLVLPIKSETKATTPESGKFGFGKSKDTKDKNKEDGKSHKRDKFKLGFFSKKRKSSKSSSKNQDEGKSNNDESLKA